MNLCDYIPSLTILVGLNKLYCLVYIQDKQECTEYGVDLSRRVGIDPDYFCPRINLLKKHSSIGFHIHG